ncbi:MarR family transcriptional regulator [Gordonia sp. SID5947]|uniref:MarR family winged helix-turn-helix transcriptional regulator n=1 Tax=Gordonia sp. SID5947 TaxID=2690315 RepID=UPI001370D467|nr:MarR family transcriptional regulator [Gordonia sp. SID5947]MYR08366.1 MarR family transcriptional regulator [Gordonia sp. SID5947]
MLDQHAVDDLFDVLSRYMRLRDRAAHTTFKTADGEFETAAFKGLFHLARESMRSRELAESLNADPSTVSRHVAQLVDLGLVRREADPADGRATLLVITDAGIERVEAMRMVRRTAMDDAMTDWTDDELWTLVRLLSRFVDAAESVIAPPCAKGDEAPRTIADFVKGKA